MNILVIGTGYVGLVSGTCFAEMGHHVTCLDINETKISSLQKGQIPIYEPGLEEMVKRNSQAKRLFFTTNYQTAVLNAEVIFLAVNTPAQDCGATNLDFLLSAAENLAQHLNRYTVIVNKSTVPCGTAEKVRQTIQKTLKNRQVDVEFDMVSNPEFLKEGDAINDCMKPDRIILGLDSEKAAQIMQEIYEPFAFNHEKVITMDIPSAEMTKYAANAMLATRISFMNELSNLCEKTGADINSVRRGIGSDARIGYSFLYAGTGYGGSCFPKDLKSLLSTAKELQSGAEIIDAVERVNYKQKRVLFSKLMAYFHDKGGLANKTFALWGLAFKPNTDDIREAPSLTLIELLEEFGCHIRAYDPVAMENVQSTLTNASNVTFCDDELDAAKGADAILLLTEWKQFRSVDLKQVLQTMKGQAFFDGRNQYKPQYMAQKGFDYFSIGRAPAMAKTQAKATL